jgi:RNA recognition motif-containing protein
MKTAETGQSKEEEKGEEKTKEEKGEERATEPTSEEALRKVYVGNLSYDLTPEGEQRLRNLFDEAGGIKEFDIRKDQRTGKLLGFGFITYKTAEAAKDALDFNDIEFEGRHLTVDLAKPKKPREREQTRGSREELRRERRESPSKPAAEPAPAPAATSSSSRKVVGGATFNFNFYINEGPAKE